MGRQTVPEIDRNTHIVLAASAARRFSLLLAGALAGIVALGVATGYETGTANVQPAPLYPENTRALVLPPPPIDPPPLLEPLLTIDLGERFPDMTVTLAPTRSLLPDSLIISYYGNPASAAMGILGAGDIETIADALAEQAARYDRLNGDIDVIPAIHLVYAVAQAQPTDNGLYLSYVDDATVQRYLKLTEERGMLLFLDLQIARSTVAAELEKILPYLRHPQVHLALDPEFAVTGRAVPGAVIGSLAAVDIGHAQAMLQALVLEERIPPKLLMVHQFIDDMVVGGSDIQPYPDVELIIDMDGFGPPDVKRATYERYAERPYAAHAAIKLFFQHDTDLMSELDVLRLEPTPAIVVYQ